VLDEYRLGVDWLVEVLGKADQSEPVWTWSKQKDIAFITRHQVQEAAVHRWDAEDAAGRQFSIDPEAAADSVDEFFDFSTAFRIENHPILDLPVLLVATDTGQEWTVGEDDQGKFWFLRHAEPSAAAATWSASASDLLLGLYRRIEPAGTFDGNRHLVEHLIARTDLN
jgi:hypothetical protein